MGHFKVIVGSLGTNVGALLVGTVFAAAGWLVTYTVENFVSVPTVEYKIDDSEKSSGRLAVTVRNLSQDHKFSDLAFLLRLPVDGSGKFESGGVDAIPPAYVQRMPTNREDFDISYPVIGLHPGTSVRLTASYTGDVVPTLHIQPSGEGARLIAKGCLTWIIRNEVEVLFGFLVAWAAMVIFILAKIKGDGGNGG